MENTTFFWILFAIVAVIGPLVASVQVSLNMEKKRKRALPQARPYQWGYFVGSIGMMGGVMNVVIGAFILKGSDLVPLYILSCLEVLCGYHIFRRTEWARSAWIGFTAVYSIKMLPFVAVAGGGGTLIAALGPAIINGIYIRNRWLEFNGIAPERLHNTLAMVPYALQHDDQHLGHFTLPDIYINWVNGDLPRDVTYWNDNLHEQRSLGGDLGKPGLLYLPMRHTPQKWSLKRLARDAYKRVVELNSIQRWILFGGLSIVLICTLIHNPTSGFTRLKDYRCTTNPLGDDRMGYLSLGLIGTYWSFVIVSVVLTTIAVVFAGNQRGSRSPREHGGTNS